MKRIKQTLPLLSTFSALLVIGVLFFAFTGVDAALQVEDVVDVIEPPVTKDQPAPDEVDFTVLAPDSESEDNKIAAEILDSGMALPEYEDTFFAAGETIELNGYFKNDVIVAGNNITITGLVDGDVIAAGANITINAPIYGDVRLAAGNITIKETIDRNATLFGGRVIIEEGAEVKRDVYVQAGDILHEGSIGGKLSGSAGTLTMNGKVGDDVYLKNVGSLRLRSKTDITGDLIYSSSEQVTQDENVKIGGEISYSPPLVEPKEQTSKFTAWFWTRKIAGLIGLWLLGLVILKLLARRSTSVVKNMLAHIGRSMFWGMIYIFTIPAILTLLLVTLIGIPLSIFGLLIFGVSLYLAKIYIGTALGKLILPQSKTLYLPMILGVSIFYVITESLGMLSFPYFFIGTFVSALGIIWAAGGIVLNFREKMNSNKDQATSRKNMKKDHGSSK